ncbi:MAG: hypothetical protein IJM32_06170 [Ruminococcus sp.]|nr:hypothetical protein [Ruminococcus sp.]
MKKHTQLERFLVFAYFGIDLNDENSDEDIIRKCVDRAYLDMCRTLKTAELSEKYKESWENIKTTMTNNLVDVLNSKHSSLVSMRNNAYEKLTGINYGQVQKWINMSLKYMWLLGLIDDSQKAELEAPIDSYIIHKINHIPKSTAWSTLTIEEYNSIKDEITTCATEYSTVIDWEFNAWIEQAKEEKRIEQEKQKKKKSNNK